MVDHLSQLHRFGVILIIVHFKIKRLKFETLLKHIWYSTARAAGIIVLALKRVNSGRLH